MTHRPKTLLAVLLIIILSGSAWFYLTRPNPVPVTLYSVQKGQVEAVVANTRAGTVKACRRARLAPATGGQIARLTVKEGERVTEGQVLMELWNADLASQVTLAERDATAARAISKEFCARAEQAKREAGRLKTLRSKGVVSVDELDRAETNAQASKAACQASKAQTSVRNAQIAVAKAALQRTILTAPFDGIVAEVNGELGEFVTPSPTGIATLPAIDLIDESCLYVSAPIDEIDAPAVKLGMVARISLDAFADQYCTGHIQRVAPYVLELEKQARTVEIEATFDSTVDCMKLLPGYSADVEVVLDIAENTLRIPSDAIKQGGEVLVYRRTDGLLQQRTVEIGISNWQWSEIKAGLQEGDLLVTSVNDEGVEAGAYGQVEDELGGNNSTRP